MSRFIICLVVSLIVLPAWSQTTVPQTAPTTQSAVPIDLSTPRGTLKVLTRAMESGDAAIIRSVFHAEGPLEQQMADAMSQMAEAIVKMRKAAQSRFRDSAGGLAGDPTLLDEELIRLDAAEETIEGDTARVMPNGKPIVLQRVGDEWKIPIAELAKDANQAEIESKLRHYQMMIRVTNEFADDILANKFRTGEEASQTYNARISRASLEATTGPTTAPTTGATAPAR